METKDLLDLLVARSKGEMVYPIFVVYSKNGQGHYQPADPCGITAICDSSGKPIAAMNGDRHVSLEPETAVHLVKDGTIKYLFTT